MVSMVLTLDVSRVSGWLNLDANCRVGRETYEARQGASREMGGCGGSGGASGMQGKARLEVERRARAERTLNMFIMPVTLDVSRFSGWLKADSCRAEKGKYKPGYMRLEVYARYRRWGRRRHRRCYVRGKGSTIEIGRKTRTCAPETCCPFF